MNKINNTILAIVLIAALSSVTSAAELHVGADMEYTTIQDAVNAASSKAVIVVHAGTYIENVEIKRPALTLQGEGADLVTVKAADTTGSVFHVNADYADISGFTVTGATDGNWGAGISIGRMSEHCNISCNNISGNRYGIIMESANSYTTIKNNIIRSNTERGIYLQYQQSTRDMILGKGIAYNGDDIYQYQPPYQSTGDKVASNLAHRNDRRGMQPEAMNDDDEGVGDGVRHNNKRGLHQTSENRSEHCNSSCNISDNSQQSTHSTIAGNEITYNGDGIYLLWSTGNNITCNLVQNNRVSGIYLCGSSTGNVIEHNNIIENGVYNAITRGWEWNLHNGQSDDVTVRHNHWGTTYPAVIAASIREYSGSVDYSLYETVAYTCTPVPDPTSPASITNLDNTTYEQTFINWTWEDPEDDDFSHVMIYINESGPVNVTKETEFYNATGLSPDTEHEITTRTVDTSGNVNLTGVTHTAWTKPAPPTISEVDEAALHVGAGMEYATIQAAVDAASPGTVIVVHAGTYIENVVINRPSITLQGEGMDLVTVEAATIREKVFRVDADYVNISGFTVTGAIGWYWGTGIYIGNGAEHCNIYCNNISRNRYGIHMQYANSYTTIENNIIRFNTERGIYLTCQPSTHSTIAGNEITYNGDGICLLLSTGNNITCNLVQNNRVSGIHLCGSSTGNVIEHNNIIENGVYNFTISGWEYNIHNCQPDDVTVRHNHWGTTDPVVIAASIREDFGSVVDYSLYETVAYTCTPTPEPYTISEADL
jgi:parallel beta-helix repeat protein